MRMEPVLRNRARIYQLRYELGFYSSSTTVETRDAFDD
jgi:hypothetical protein